MKLLALKIDVDLCRGAREGVPRILDALQARGVRASFLFNLGPDQSGRAWRAIWAGGWRSRGTRISLLDHYGLRACLSGTLLPARDMHLACSAAMQSVRAMGHEAGIRAWNSRQWQKCVGQADILWTSRELDRASGAFQAVFAERARVFGAAGWRMNRAAFRWQQQNGLKYASDTRGTHPFWPVIDGEPVRCLQLPTTLPTMPELVRSHGFDEEKLLSALLQKTEDEPFAEHVFSLSAEFEGLQWLGLFERLLDGWLAQGYRIVSLADLCEALNPADIPYHEVTETRWPGQPGLLAVQGRVFPH